MASAVALATAGGCEAWDPGAPDHTAHHDVLLAPYGSVSVYQLAWRLDMEVVSADVDRAALRDGRANTVRFTSDPDGQAYVNGQSVWRDGGIAPIGELLFVPLEIETPIRRALASARRRRATQPKPSPPSRLPPAEPSYPVVIDAGHGGKDIGAPSVNGMVEKDINLPVALEVARLLRSRNVPVILTRSDDVFLGLNERAAIANRARARVFVSIHSNSAEGNSSANGYEVFTARTPDSASVALAEAILQEMAVTGAASRGVREENFRVLVQTACPSALVELGFLSNSHEAAALARDSYQRLLATAIADGIVRAMATIPPRRPIGNNLDAARAGR